MRGFASFGFYVACTYACHVIAREYLLADGIEWWDGGRGEEYKRSAKFLCGADGQSVVANYEYVCVSRSLVVRLDTYLA